MQQNKEQIRSTIKKGIYDTAKKKKKKKDRANKKAADIQGFYKMKYKSL
jgi:hypothetical protein